VRCLAALALAALAIVAPARYAAAQDGSAGIPDAGGGFDGVVGTDGGLVVNPTFLDLGQRDLGGGPSTLNGGFSLQNINDTTVSITVSGYYKPSSTECNPFSINTNGTLPQIIGPGQLRTWSVAFSSSTPGYYYCRVDIIDTDGDYDFIDLYAEVVTPVMVVSPLPTMNFGDVEVGNAAIDWITIQNDGTSNLILSNVNKTGSTDFTMMPVTTPLVISPASSTVVMITYTPGAAGMDTGTVAISGNDPANFIDTVSLAGNGVAVVTSPHFVLSPSPVAFGSVNVGSNSNRTLTIENDGSSSGEISLLQITGSDAAQFTLQSVCPGMQSCTTPIMVGAGDSYSLGLRCTPTSAGDKFATLTVTSDASNSPTSVSLTCTGTAPDVSVTPLSLDFGTVRLGNSSPMPYPTVTVRNLGNATLNYTLSETGHAADFAATPACTTTCTLAPGGMTTHSVVFTPQAYGSRAAELRVVSNDPIDATVPVYLAGVGGAGLIEIVSPASGTIAFGDIPAGTTSSPQPLQIRNAGNMTLTLTQLVVTLGNGVFVIDGTVTPPNIVIAPGASHNVTVTCSPPAVMGYNGTIFVQGNDPNDSDHNINLTCNGIDSDLVATPAPISFDPTRVGDSDLVPVTVENIGGVAIMVDTITADQAVFTLENLPTLPMSLGAGGMITFDVRFTPEADGDVGGMLTVTSSADPLQVALNGPGRVASFTVEPDGFDFGTLCVGMSTVQRFTVTSTGSADIEVSLPALSDPDSAFDIAMIDPAPADYPAMLTPQGMAVFDIVAMPPEGDSAGSIAVTTDVETGGTADLPITVSAIAEGVALSPSPVDFSTVVINETSEIHTVTLANCDPVPLMVTAVDITGPDADSFSVGGTLPPPDLMVAVQGSVQWTVVFEPERLGDHTATLEVTTSAGVMTVPLSGVGESASGDGGVDGGAGFDTTSYYACACRGGADPGGALPFAALLLLLLPRRRRRSP
jgi:MYXO-CTERM domain-containing protein